MPVEIGKTNSRYCIPEKSGSRDIPIVHIANEIYFKQAALPKFLSPRLTIIKVIKIHIVTETLPASGLNQPGSYGIAESGVSDNNPVGSIPVSIKLETRFVQ